MVARIATYSFTGDAQELAKRAEAGILPILEAQPGFKSYSVAICEGKVHPTLSKVFTLEDSAEAAYQVHHNMHEGKLGVLCLAPEEGLGVTDGEMRERLLPQITLFRRHA